MSNFGIKKNTTPSSEMGWGILELDAKLGAQEEVRPQLPLRPEFFVESLITKTSLITDDFSDLSPAARQFSPHFSLNLSPPIDDQRAAAAQRLKSAVQDRIQMYTELGQPVGIMDRVMNFLTIPLWMASPDYRPLNNHEDFDRFKKGYETALNLIHKGNLEDALTLVFILEADPKIPEMMGNAEFAESFVKYGVNVGLVLTAGFISGVMVGALGLTEAGTAALMVRSTSFVGAHRILGEVLTGQPMLYDRNANVKDNAFYLAEEIMLTAGMFRFIGLAGKTYSEALQAKFGDLSPLTMTAMTEGLVYTGAFATEYTAFTGWEMAAQLYQMTKHQDFNLEDFLNHSLSPEAMEERLLFLAALKVGSSMARALPSDANAINGEKNYFPLQALAFEEHPFLAFAGAEEIQTRVNILLSKNEGESSSHKVNRAPIPTYIDFGDGETRKLKAIFLDADKVVPQDGKLYQVETVEPQAGGEVIIQFSRVSLSEDARYSLVFSREELNDLGVLVIREDSHYKLIPKRGTNRGEAYFLIWPNKTGFGAEIGGTRVHQVQHEDVVSSSAQKSPLNHKPETNDGTNPESQHHLTQAHHSLWEGVSRFMNLLLGRGSEKTDLTPTPQEAYSWRPKIEFLKWDEKSGGYIFRMPIDAASIRLRPGDFEILGNTEFFNTEVEIKRLDKFFVLDLIQGEATVRQNGSFTENPIQNGKFIDPGDHISLGSGVEFVFGGEG